MTEGVVVRAVKAKPCGRCAAWTESAPVVCMLSFVFLE
jgi:hypothetical protein